MKIFSLRFLFILSFVETTVQQKSLGGKPNIILIVADDLGETLNFDFTQNSNMVSGVHDVSWNNPLARTPNLEKLARDGFILDNAYTLPVCSPSRAAILTGVYPFKMGLQVS